MKHRNFVRFLDYVRPYTTYLLLAVAGGIVKFTVPLLVPQVTRHLLDNVFLNQAITGTLVGISPLIVICFGGYRVIMGAMAVARLVS